jgi:hypothetical protein
MRHRSPVCFALLLATLGCAPAWACDVPGHDMVMSRDEHLALARDVSVARVVRATPLGDGQLNFEFEVLRRLTGPERQAFSVKGVEDVPRQPRDKDDPQARKLFPNLRFGRLRNNPDCSIQPSFLVGKTYLVFLDQQLTHLSFEEIPMVDGKPDPQDEWLLYVEARLRTSPR